MLRKTKYYQLRRDRERGHRRGLRGSSARALHDALYLAAGLTILAGLLAAATLGGRQPGLISN